MTATPLVPNTICSQKFHFYVYSILLAYMHACLKKPLDALGLKLQAILSHVSARKWTWVLWKNRQFCQPLSYLSSTTNALRLGRMALHWSTKWLRVLGPLVRPLWTCVPQDVVHVSPVHLHALLSSHCHKASWILLVHLYLPETTFLFPHHGYNNLFRLWSPSSPLQGHGTQKTFRSLSEQPRGIRKDYRAIEPLQFISFISSIHIQQDWGREASPIFCGSTVLSSVREPTLPCVSSVPVFFCLSEVGGRRQLFLCWAWPHAGNLIFPLFYFSSIFISV